MQALTHPTNQIPLLHQESSIPSLLRNPLRAPQVQVHRITPSGHLLRSSEPQILVVGAELNDEWSVVWGESFERFGRGVELLFGVAGVGGGAEETGVEHGGVGEGGTV